MLSAPSALASPPVTWVFAQPQRAHRAAVPVRPAGASPCCDHGQVAPLRASGPLSEWLLMGGCSAAPAAVSSPQEPKTDQDEEHCRKVNEYLNNPPMPGALGASGSAGHELSALGGNGHLPGFAVRSE